jgi:hypothetical protein
MLIDNSGGGGGVQPDRKAVNAKMVDRITIYFFMIFPFDVM